MFILVVIFSPIVEEGLRREVPWFHPTLVITELISTHGALWGLQDPYWTILVVTRFILTIMHLVAARLTRPHAIWLHALTNFFSGVVVYPYLRSVLGPFVYDDVVRSSLPIQQLYVDSVLGGAMFGVQMYYAYLLCVRVRAEYVRRFGVRAAGPRRPNFVEEWRKVRVRLDNRWLADAHTALPETDLFPGYMDIPLYNTAEIVDSTIDLLDRGIISPRGGLFFSCLVKVKVGETWRLALPVWLFREILFNTRGFMAASDSFTDFAAYLHQSQDGLINGLTPQSAERLLLAVWTMAHANTPFQVLVGAVQVYHALYPGRAVAAEVILLMGSVSHEFLSASSAKDIARAALYETMAKVMKLLFLRPYTIAPFLPLPDSVHRMFRSIGTSCRDSPALAEELASLLEMVVFKLPRSIATGDWTAWSKHDELTEIEAHFSAARVLRGESYGPDLQRKVDLNEFRYQLHEMEERLKGIAADSARTAVARAEARRILMMVVAERAMFHKSYGDNFSRARPFALHFVGNPGVGKSNVLEMIVRNALVSNGEAMPDKLAYTIRDGQEYFDAYNGTEPLVIVNDPGISTTYTDNPLNFFIPLLTNESYSPNNARAELKETSRASPRVVALTTNELRVADRFIRTPSAFYRRWHYVLHITAKKEYTSNGVWLDETKCLDAKGGDFYNISICRWIPDESTPLGVNCTEIAETMGVREAMIFIAQEYREHMKRQRVLVARLNDRSTDLCSHCGVLFAMHPNGCPSEGKRVSAPVRAKNSNLDDPSFQFPEPAFLKKQADLRRGAEEAPAEAKAEAPVVPDVVIPEPEGEHVAGLEFDDQAQDCKAAGPSARWVVLTGVLWFAPWTMLAVLVFPFVVAGSVLLWATSRVVDVVSPGADALSRAEIAWEVVVAGRMVVQELLRRMRGDANTTLTPLWMKAARSGLTVRQRIHAIRVADLVSYATPKVAVLGVTLILGAVAAWRIKRQAYPEPAPFKEERQIAAGPLLSIARPVVDRGPTLPVMPMPSSVRCTPTQAIELATRQARVVMACDGEEAYGVSVGGQFVLTYAHSPVVRSILEAREQVVVTVSSTTAAAVAPRVTHPVTAGDVAVLEGRDLALVRMRGLAPMRKYRYFPQTYPTDGTPTMVRVWAGDEAEPRGVKVAIYSHHKSLHEHGEFGPYYETPEPVRFGHCGSVLVGERCEILGLAVAIRGTTGRSMFVYFTEGDVGVLMAKLGVAAGGEMYAAEPMQEILELYPDVTMVSLDERAAVRKIPAGYGMLNAKAVGTLEPTHNSADKSKMEHTMFYEKVVERESWVEGKWSPPHGKVCDTARGRMDAYSKMMANLTEQNDDRVDHQVAEAALADYTANVVSLGCDPYVKEHGPIRPLTLDEAVRGTAEIFPLPPATASGMPHGGSKRDYYIPDPTAEDPDNYRLDEEAYTLYGKYMETLERGEVPSIPAKVFLKLNEVRPTAKVEQAGTRTINALPFPYNLIIKRYFGPIFKALRGNVEAWESCIGVNMGSHDAARLVAHLARYPLPKHITKSVIRDLAIEVDEMEKSFRDTDAIHFDDSFTAYKFDLQRRFMIAVARALGYSAADVKIVGLIIASLANMCYIIRGDLIQFLKNSSGHGMTAEVNSVMASFLYRYIFYAAKRDGLIPKDATFSDFMRLLTYGDDAASSTKRDFSWTGEQVGGIPFAKIVEYGAEFGFQLTPGDKGSDPPEWKRLEEITFLKRRFVIDVNEGIVRTPLEEASIWRMLSWKRPAAVGKVEFHAMLLANAQREWWMYGRERFEKETLWLRQLAQTFSLEQYVAWKSFDELRDAYEQGKFSTWDL